MENSAITGHKELVWRIEQLKIEKIRQELELKLTVNEFVNTLNPVTMVKESLHELAEDNTVQVDLIKATLNIGANFILEHLIGKHPNMSGLLSSVLVENISSLLINNNVSKLFSGISKQCDPHCE
jgi:hypothetical protein